MNSGLTCMGLADQPRSRLDCGSLAWDIAPMWPGQPSDHADELLHLVHNGQTGIRVDALRRCIVQHDNRQACTTQRLDEVNNLSQGKAVPDNRHIERL